MDLYVEPVLPRATLMVLGHGLIAETLAELGHLLELRVVVNDALATPESFPHADLCIREDPEYAKVDCAGETYVVVTTQHKSDYEALGAVLRSDPTWVGLVASRKRSALLFERLVEDGFAAGVVERVSAPCGLDVGAATPQEIAVSVLAEILLRRHGEASGRPLVETRGALVRERAAELPDPPG